MKEILNHIINNYGFTKVNMPYNNKKLNLFKKLYNKYPKILKFLRIFSSVKHNKALDFLNDCIILQKQIYTNKGDDGYCSVIIKPSSYDNCYFYDIKNIFEYALENYIVYIEFSGCCALTEIVDIDFGPFIKAFPLNNINSIENIDLNFADIPELKQIKRNIKIDNIIKK